MEKFNFKNRIQSNPRLLRLKNPTTGEIIDYEIQDLQESEIVENGTEMTAEVLNTMQSNIEESCVVVSPTQPETGEKVWIQKGKNLISPSNIFKGYDIEENTTDLTVYGNGLTTGWIQVLPNTTYTLSGGNRCRFQFKNDNGVVTYGGTNATNPYSFTTLADTKYVRIYFYDYYNAPITYPELPKVQLEQGSTATEYEAYVEPKIWCKNDNGVFEEFKKIEDTGWIQCTPYSSDIEFIDWSPLQYRKIGKVVYISGAVKVTNPTWNKPITQLPYRFAQEIDSICRTTDANNKISTVGIAGNTGILSFLETSVDSTDTSTTPIVFINISVPVAD